MSVEFQLKSDYEPTNFKYNLDIIEWQERKIEVKVNFTDPLLISQGLYFDRLEVIVIDNNYIVSAKTC